MPSSEEMMGKELVPERLLRARRPDTVDAEGDQARIAGNQHETR